MSLIECDKVRIDLGQCDADFVPVIDQSATGIYICCANCDVSNVKFQIIVEAKEFLTVKVRNISRKLFTLFIDETALLLDCELLCAYGKFKYVRLQRMHTCCMQSCTKYSKQRRSYNISFATFPNNSWNYYGLQSETLNQTKFWHKDTNQRIVFLNILWFVVVKQISRL